MFLLYNNEEKNANEGFPAARQHTGRFVRPVFYFSDGFQNIILIFRNKVNLSVY